MAQPTGAQTSAMEIHVLFFHCMLKTASDYSCAQQKLQYRPCHRLGGEDVAAQPPEKRCLNTPTATAARSTDFLPGRVAMCQRSGARKP
eukprot:27162-Amphidinium_carterae.2